MHHRATMTVVLCLLLLGLAPSVLADDIHLKLAGFFNGNHRYFHRLLNESLSAAGHTVHIAVEDDLPQPRIVRNLASGDISLYWMLQTRERDEQYVAVNHKLTQGLIGQRVMLIPKGEEAAYAKVETLADLRSTGKVAGLGQGWFDVSVWRGSGLLVEELGGEWRKLYAMIAAKNRGIDYFPRGANEIVAEAKANPALAIEPRLLLVYARDFVFYLSKSDAALRAPIEAALRQAEKSGLQKRLIDEYFGPSVASLNLAGRVKIVLPDPGSN